MRARVARRWVVLDLSLMCVVVGGGVGGGGSVGVGVVVKRCWEWWW